MTTRSTAAAIFLTATLVLTSFAPARAQTKLEKFASLPADSFAPGPTSGQFIAPANGRVPPFEDQQPIQGISSVLQAWNGDFLVMSDNGFGAKDNSQDYVLRVYRIKPNFRTKNGGRGTIRAHSFITLSDPYRRINFPIVADREFYPGNAMVPDDTIPVDDEIRRRRLLTGGRLRHRVVPRSAGRHAVVRRRVRPVPDPDRRQRPRAPRANSAARRKVASESVSDDRRNAESAAQQGLRGDGDYAGRKEAVSDARRGVDDRRDSVAPHHQ